MKRTITLLLILIYSLNLIAKEYHVSVKGKDTNDGSVNLPLKTISATAAIAQAGDKVTVHAGTYRELINPVYGGTGESVRIIYQAASGEEVKIKGSEVVNTWENLKEGVWKVTIPEKFFGNYNPYRDSIYGDWFNEIGRAHV